MSIAPPLPGDKSIAIRAILLAVLARGASTLRGIGAGDDVSRALDVAQQLGARVVRSGDDVVIHAGVAVVADATLDCGGSQTLLRLVAGLMVGQGLGCTLDGNAQLRSRPQHALAEVLRAMGGTLSTTWPLRVSTELSAPVAALTVEITRASAQLKGAVLFAALGRSAVTTVRESTMTRVHTEALLHEYGANVDVTTVGTVVLRGPFVPPARDVAVPRDVSSAAFLLVATAAKARSTLSVNNISIATGRDGIWRALKGMGASVVFSPRASVAGAVADVVVRGAELRACTISADEVASLVDEVPALACLCAQATGVSYLNGLTALRTKESDRINATQSLLHAFGVRCDVDGDALCIVGAGTQSRPSSPVAVRTFGDHRIAMAAMSLGRAWGCAVTLDDASCVDKSFPAFDDVLHALPAS